MKIIAYLKPTCACLGVRAIMKKYGLNMRTATSTTPLNTQKWSKIRAATFPCVEIDGQMPLT